MLLPVVNNPVPAQPNAPPIQQNKMSRPVPVNNQNGVAAPASGTTNGVDDGLFDAPDDVLQTVGENMGGRRKTGEPKSVQNSNIVTINKDGPPKESSIYPGREFQTYTISKDGQSLKLNFPIGFEKGGFDDNFSDAQRESIFNDLTKIFDTAAGAQLMAGGADRPNELFFFQMDAQRANEAMHKDRREINLPSFNNQATNNGSAGREQATGATNNGSPTRTATNANDNMQPMQRLEGLLNSLIDALFGFDSEQSSADSELKQSILNEIEQNEAAQAQRDVDAGNQAVADRGIREDENVAAQAKPQAKKPMADAPMVDTPLADTPKIASEKVAAEVPDLPNFVEADPDAEENINHDDPDYSVNGINPDENSVEDFNVNVIDEPENEEIIRNKRNVTEENPNDQYETFDREHLVRSSSLKRAEPRK